MLSTNSQEHKTLQDASPQIAGKQSDPPFLAVITDGFLPPLTLNDMASSSSDGYRCFLSALNDHHLAAAPVCMAPKRLSMSQKLLVPNTVIR